jgi:hypothetical protein
LLFSCKVLRISFSHQFMLFSIPINFLCCHCLKMRYKDIKRVQSIVIDPWMAASAICGLRSCRKAFAVIGSVLSNTMLLNLIPRMV